LILSTDDSPSPSFYTLSLHDALPISRAESVAGPVGDRPHRRPHRHVLHRNAADAGEIAELHRLAILQMMIGERAQRVPIIICRIDRKSTRLNSSHVKISYAVFCLKKK